MVFEAVEVLVAFAAGVAAVRLVLFHAQSARIWVQGFGINDGEGAVAVVFESLGIVAVLVGVSRGQCSKRERLECLRSCGTSSHFGSCMPFHIQ